MIVSVVKSLYTTSKDPEFGNPTVESTSMNVCPIPISPIHFVFGCIEKLSYINSVFDPSFLR